MADSITNPRYPTWRSAAEQLWKEGKIKVSSLAGDLTLFRQRGALTGRSPQAVYRGFVPGILRAFPTVS